MKASYIIALLIISNIFFSSACIRDIEVNDTKPSTPDTQVIQPQESSSESEQIKKLTESDIIVSQWITDLHTPWSLVFLDDQRALVTERGGRVFEIIN